MRFTAAVASAFAVVASAQDLQSVLSGNSNVSSLVGLLTSNPALLSALGSAQNITVLAPSNNALSALLNTTAGSALASNPGAVQALLQYHVLNGSLQASGITDKPSFARSLLTNTTYTNVTRGQRVQAIKVGNATTFYSGKNANSTVSQSLNFTGGVIHVINSVLTIPYSASRNLADASLSSLYGALNATKLLTTVDGLKDVTIFAPNNAAFQRIGSVFTNASTDTLTKVLTYHALADTTNPYYSTRLVNGTSLQTVNGQNLTVYNVNGTWFVNQAKIVSSDLLVSGGVVHVIDQVLNPDNKGGVPTNSTAGQIAFPGASSATAPPFTSGAPSATGTVATRPTGGSSSSSTAGAPAITGAIGAAGLFAGAAFLANL